MKPTKQMDGYFKKVECLRKDNPYEVLTSALNTPDIESIIVVFQTKEGDVYSSRDCLSRLGAIGMLETVKHDILEEWEED